MSAERACLTPGCVFDTRVTSYDFKSSAIFKLSVHLPGPLKIPETENRVGGFKARDEYLKQIEDILHQYLEAATASIGQLDLAYGGDLAKSWPRPPATITDAFDVGFEVGLRKAAGVRR